MREAICLPLLFPCLPLRGRCPEGAEGVYSTCRKLPQSVLRTASSLKEGALFLSLCNGLQILNKRGIKQIDLPLALALLELDPEGTALLLGDR